MLFAGVQASLTAMESIHQRIRRLREKKGLTQQELAKVVGVSYQSVQEWERDKGTAPSRKRQEAVSQALGVTLNELMTGDRLGPAVDTPVMERLIRAFSWLTDEQQRVLMKDLEAKAETNKAISRELGARWEFKSDADVGHHIAPAPKQETSSRKRK